MQQIKSWQPSASIKNLQRRAEMIKKIRQFFEDRQVLEVDTPLLSYAGTTERHLVSFTTTFNQPGSCGSQLYLITSPEYHMKRLLAAGSGPIYQINHCFRNEERGRIHNPEFTMLEWYRPNFSLMQLIDEIDELLRLFLEYSQLEKISYQQAFLTCLDIDPLTISDQQLLSLAQQHHLQCDADTIDRDTLLQFLFSYLIEPMIGKTAPIAVYDFPASQASLAKVSEDDPRVAQRFEIYFRGVELANGFNELLDAVEQQQRFEQDNQLRQQYGLPTIAIDQHFLAALQAGMPTTSGVAIGLDRMIMLALNSTELRDVLSFDIQLA